MLNSVIMYRILFSALLIQIVASQIQNDLFTKSDFSSESDHTSTLGYSEDSENKVTVLLPKCCPHGFSVGEGNCSQSNVTFQPDFSVHKHNETAFDDEPIDAKLITFETYIRDSCRGLKFPLSPEENPIFLQNGSVLLAGMGEYDGILGHNQFCIDNLNMIPGDTTVYTFICVKDQEETIPTWVFSAYITLVTISAILFTSSAVFFYRQEVRGVHKKSFIAFAGSMSSTYLIIILMQFISWGCTLFGLLLQFLVTHSFCWLAILCFDLAWSIHYYRVKENKDRFIFYAASCLIFSVLFLVISSINSLTPDIPFAFFKPQFERTSCIEFENQRSSLFIIAIAITIGTSMLSLCYSLIKMNQNRYRNTDVGVQEWRKVSKKYSYMYGRKLVVFVSMIIWILDAFSDRLSPSSSISIIILCIQAFLGFIVVPLYTMSTLRRVIKVNKKPRIENLEELLEGGTNHVYRVEKGTK